MLARSTRPIWGKDGKIAGRIWEYEDQTELVTARRELRRLESLAKETEVELEQLRTAHSVLESSLEPAQRSESLALFAEGIGHDFNNLLVGMLGNISIAQSEVDSNSPLGELLEQIRDAGSHASELVTEMLEFAGRNQPQPERYDLSRMIDQTFGILHSAVHSDCALELDLAEELPPVEVDATRIRQVLVNLVSNGSEALRGEIGTVRISTTVAELTRERLAEAVFGADREPGPYVAISVTDTGSGIDEADRERIFEPFFTTRICARGLGLAAVRSILEEHSGALELESEAGSGTTMTVWLPAVVGRGLAAAPVDEPEDDGGKGWTGSGRVLLVDDNFTVLEVGQRMLRILGFEVESYQSGFDAVEEFRLRPDRFDLAIVDLTMPQMDGSETVRQLREVRPELPIVISSGYSAIEVASRADERTAYLHKPYTLRELRLQLRALDRHDEADWLE